MHLKKSLSTAQILSGNSSPILLVDAPGANYAIQVNKVAFAYTKATTAFGTNTILQVITDTATVSQYEADILGNAASTFSNIVPTTLGASNMIANKGLYAKVKTGDATAGGTSSVIIYLDYSIVTL